MWRGRPRPRKTNPQSYSKTAFLARARISCSKRRKPTICGEKMAAIFPVADQTKIRPVFWPRDNVAISSHPACLFGNNQRRCRIPASSKITARGTAKNSEAKTDIGIATARRLPPLERTVTKIKIVNAANKTKTARTRIAMPRPRLNSRAVQAVTGSSFRAERLISEKMIGRPMIEIGMSIPNDTQSAFIVPVRGQECPRHITLPQSPHPPASCRSHLCR